MRALKADGRTNLEVQSAVAELKKRKSTLERREKELAPREGKTDRAKLEDTLKRRFFYAPSFSIYGGMMFGSVDDVCVIRTHTHNHNHRCCWVI